MIIILKSLSSHTIKYFKILFYFTLFIIFDFYVQFIFGANLFNIEFDKIYNRYTGIFGEERIFGNFILYFGFLSVALYNKFKKVSDLNNFFIFSLIALTILLTGDRTPFLSLFYFLIFLFIFSNKKKFILITSVIIFSCSTIIINFSDRLSNKYPINLIFNYSETLETLPEEMKKEGSVRSVSANSLISTNSIFKKYQGHYSRALDIFKANPILGSGFRSYRKVCGGYETLKQPNQYDTDKDRRLSCSIHPHNYHLEILSETGLIGYLIFLSFIIYSFSLFFKKKNDKSFSLTLIFCLILTYILPF
jgi:O-Antigen ligase.